MRREAKHHAALDSADVARMISAFPWHFGREPKRRRRCALPAHSKTWRQFEKFMESPLWLLRMHWDHEPNWTIPCCRCNTNLSERFRWFMANNPARQERLVQRELELEKYDVALRERVLRVRRKILRQLLKSQTSTQAIPR